jgi:hypothetical protein
VFLEYWRFYQSGQFDHYLALREDHMAKHGLFHPQFFMPAQGKKYLAITASIYMITNIVEFAARLAYQNVLTPTVVLKIELHKMAGRLLTYMQPGRRLPDVSWFKNEVVELRRVWPTEEVIGRSQELAIDLASELFSQADWTPPLQLLAEDQSRCTASR